MGREHDRTHAQAEGDPNRMQPPGTTECVKVKVPRIVAFCKGDATQRTLHVSARDVQHGYGSLLRVEACWFTQQF